MKKTSWLIIIFIYCIGIFLFTHSPVSSGDHTLHIWDTYFSFSPELNRVMNLLTRKMTHIITFGLLAYLFYRFFHRQKYILPWFFASMYGALDEWHQTFIEGRMGTITDVCINSFSAFCVIIFVYFRNKRKISE